MIRRVRFTTAMRVEGLQSFAEYVLTTAKRVKGLLMFAGSVLTTVRRVGGLRSLGERFDHHKAWRRLADLLRVSFLLRKAYSRLEEVRRLNFNHPQA